VVIEARGFGEVVKGVVQFSEVKFREIHGVVKRQQSTGIRLHLCEKRYRGVERISVRRKKIRRRPRRDAKIILANKH
jgi:hypothetical protein